MKRWEFIIKDHVKGWDTAGHIMSETDLADEKKVDAMLAKTKEYIKHGILGGKFDK